MRWVLVRPLHKSSYYDPEIQEPLGPEYLAAGLASQGDSVLVLDCSLEGVSDERIARRTAAFQPDVVGLSLTTATQVESARAIYEECTRAAGGRPLLWSAGGNFVSAEPAAAARMLPHGTVLVRGEGERSLCMLARMAAERTLPVAEILEALPASSGAGADVPWLVSPPVEDLDMLPFPVRPYADQVAAAGRAFNISGSRGCSGACRYCASAGVLSDVRGGRRERSVENIIEEMQTLARRHGACSFNFVDEDFLGPESGAARRAGRFAGLLADWGTPVSFGIQVRPTSLSDEAIDSLAAAGLAYVFVGIESDDPADMARWNRPFVEDPWRAVDRLHALGIEVGAGTLLYHPDSTIPGIRRFARKLRAHRLLDCRTATNRMDAMPGAPFHQAEIAAGRIQADAAGPRRLGFLDPRIEALHRDVEYVLQPLGPPSMHALCALPPLLVRRHQDARFDDRRAVLAEVGRLSRDMVSAALFALLDGHEKGGNDGGLSGSLRTICLDTSLLLTRKLADAQLADADSLREAIRIDSGM